MKINLHNRNMMLLLMSGLIFIMVSILNFAYVMALQSTTSKDSVYVVSVYCNGRIRKCSCQLYAIAVSLYHCGSNWSSIMCILYFKEQEEEKEEKIRIKKAGVSI